MAVSDGIAAAEALDEIVRFVIRQNAVLREVSFTATATLGRLDSAGPCRLTELAAQEGVSQPSMTVMVSRLERQEFVRRNPDPSDARIVLVSITETGRDLLRRRRAARVAFLAHLIEHLGHDDQQTLAGAVPALLRLTDPAEVPAAVAAAKQASTDHKVEKE